jgi:hypothetical protein
MRGLQERGLSSARTAWLAVDEAGECKSPVKTGGVV